MPKYCLTIRAKQDQHSRFVTLSVVEKFIIVINPVWPIIHEIHDHGLQRCLVISNITHLRIMLATVRIMSLDKIHIVTVNTMHEETSL